MIGSLRVYKYREYGVDIGGLGDWGSGATGLRGYGAFGGSGIPYDVIAHVYSV